MHLVENWKSILKKAWSIRLILVAALLSGLEVILPYFVSNMPRGLFAMLSMLTTTGAFVARIVVQKELHSGKDNAPQAKD